MRPENIRDLRNRNGNFLTKAEMKNKFGFTKKIPEKIFEQNYRRERS